MDGRNGGVSGGRCNWIGRIDVQVEDEDTKLNSSQYTRADSGYRSIASSMYLLLLSLL